MLNQRPIVYIDKNFLLKFFNKLNMNSFVFMNNELLFFLKRLIFDESKLYINLNNNDIEKCIICGDNPENDLSFIISNISKSSNFLVPLTRTFDFTDVSNYINMQNIPIYILADIDYPKALQLNKNTGLIFISSDFDNYDKNYNNKVINCFKHRSYNLEKGQTVIYKDIFLDLFRSNKIYIEDKYFCNTKPDLVDEIINSLISTNFTNSNYFDIYLLYQEKSKIEFSFIYNLKEYYKIKKNPFNFKIHFYNVNYSDTMHERNILINSIWFHSSHSFMNKYNTPVTIMANPIVFYYPSYIKKYDFILSLIKKNNVTTVESFFNSF